MKNILIILSVLSLITFSCGNMKKDADLIVKNAKVYTVDDNFTVASAFAVKNGKILKVGATEEITRAYSGDKTLDLEDRPVYPGFIDAHCHFYGYSMDLRQVDLVGTSSFEAILEKLKQYDQTHDAEWILGRGWDQNDWEDTKFPTKEKLDKLFPDKPVFLNRIDGHAALVNSEALERAGITAETDVEGGKVYVENGKPTGILVDNATSLVSKIIPEPDRQEKISALKKGAQNCFGVGLTSVVDAGLGYESIHLMDSLQQAGKLKMQTYVMLSPSENNYEAFMEKGIYRTNYMHIQSIKLFADGALGSRGACLLEPYSDDPKNTGFLVTSKKELREHAQKAYEYNYQVNTHAIGDSANRVMLNIYGSILGGENDRRWRIEHAQVIHPDDFSLFNKYSVIPAINTTHATSDMYWADERLGKERLKNAYAYKKLLKQNGWLCNGSDFPVEDINPLYGFYAGVARKDLEGYPEGGFQPENALTRKQALKAMTIWAARSMFEEEDKGSIEKGKQADFVVTDKDIMEIEMEEVPEVKVLKTFVQGEEVYKVLNSK
ncbi:MAG: amidohydrolase [Bacteroidales bacterium]